MNFSISKAFLELGENPPPIMNVAFVTVDVTLNITLC